MFDGIWTSSSGQKQFQDVINAFNKKYPNVKVNYNPVGDSLPTVLATAVAGGHPPDMADIAQPGTVQQFATQGKLKPITYATGTINKNYAPGVAQLGTFNGKLYALVFKAANKSLVWYNVPAFKTAGVKPPKTWTQLLAAAKTIKASGTPAYSIGGADGWTLTDMFENIYLRTFGPAKYEALSRAQDQVDRPVGRHRAEDDGADPRRHRQPRRRLAPARCSTASTSPSRTRSARRRRPRWCSRPTSSAASSLSSTKAKAEDRLQRLPVPDDQARPGSSGVEIAGDLFVTFRTLRRSGRS